MVGIIHFETFLLTGILLNLTPGNDTFYILTRSIGQGKRAGLVSALGIGTGSIVHTILAALGLSIVIAKSILLFNMIKYAGGAYLIYVGWGMLMSKGNIEANVLPGNKLINYSRIYRDAIITNVLNPKVALFFIAFLPQFIVPGSKNTVFLFLTLGITFVTTGTIWCLILANFASLIFANLKNKNKLSTYIHKVCGLTIIGIGIKLTFTGRK